ncbi:MAG: hypothetical protein EOP04_18000, partial [Proteobacteria bacterium]
GALAFKHGSKTYISSFEIAYWHKMPSADGAAVPARQYTCMQGDSAVCEEGDSLCGQYRMSACAEPTEYTDPNANWLEVPVLNGIPTFRPGPLSMEATELVKKYPEYFNGRIQRILKTDNDPFGFEGLKYVKSVEESKMLNFRSEPCVIISASGMAEAGRVKHHISNNIENSHNTILLTGYCEPNSLGGRLSRGATEVSIFGIPHEVHAEVGAIRSMSAHGDYEDLSQWLACQSARDVKKLFLVHGEFEVQQAFRDRLQRKGFLDVSIPERHEEVGLG